MTASFSLYLPRESGLHRLHPLTKLTLAVFFFLAGLALRGVWTPFLIFIVGLFPQAIWGRIGRVFLGRVGQVVLPFAVSLLLIQGLFWQGGQPIFHLGPLSVKEEGVLFALQSTGRILVIVASFVAFSLTTPPDALMTALAERGMPATLTFIVLATLQIVPRFQTRASAILDAQRSRGLEVEASISHRVRALLPLVVPLILGSLVEIEDRAIALEARAFSRKGPRTSLLELKDTRPQVGLRLLLVLGMMAIIAGRLFVWIVR